MNIAIGADHRGFELKAYIKQYVVGAGDPIAWIDVGASNDERSDFPLFTNLVCQAIQKAEVDRGILICGSGIGMSIAANRYNFIHAALVWNDQVAIHAKEHNNANVLVIPADFVSHELAVSMINKWLTATFKGGRYQERIAMIDAIKIT